MDQITKTCPRCSTSYPLDDTHWYRRAVPEAHTFRPTCKRCFVAQTNTLQACRRYGLTVEQVLALRQRDECDICGGTNANGKQLSIDHDHRTGRVRGVLCEACNHAVGKFKDAPHLLVSAIAYLIAGDN